MNLSQVTTPISSTKINSEKAREVLDTNIFELLPEQRTRQDEVNSFFQQFDRLIVKCNDKLNAGAVKQFYIGIYNNYEWLDRIVYKLKTKKEYNEVNHYCSTNRVKINRKRRREVWEKRNGPNSTQGPCYVCQQNISIHDFECGHIESVFYGGGIELNNLEPICRGCNNAMSAENLEDYKKRMYPD